MSKTAQKKKQKNSASSSSRGGPFRCREGEPKQTGKGGKQERTDGKTEVVEEIGFSQTGERMNDEWREGRGHSPSQKNQLRTKSSCHERKPEKLQINELDRGYG